MNFMAASKSLSDWFDTKDSKEQRDAAALALLQNFMLITGGPGTGKTTTVAKLLGLICNNSTKLPRIALAAPTGKAAAHMARALQRALDGFDFACERQSASGKLGRADCSSFVETASASNAPCVQS